MKKKMKFVRTGIIALITVLALSVCLVSCGEDEVVDEETTGLEEGPSIPTKADVANTINGYVDQLLGQMAEPEDPEAIDVTNLLKELSNINIVLENPSPDNSVFGGMDKIVFANNVLHANGKTNLDGQTINSSYIMRLTENGIIYLSGENGKYTGEYQTWFDMLNFEGEDAFAFSQIDINAIKAALKVEESDIKVVEEGVYEIKSSYIINAIKDTTKALGYEDTDGSVSLDTLFNMSLVVDVRQHAEGIMIISLDIPDIVDAKLNILDKDELKVDYELHILGGEDASETDTVATLTGSFSVKAAEFDFSMNLDIPSESASFKVACTGRNVEAQLSANLSIDVQILEPGYEEKTAITAEVSAETDADGDITLASAKASMKYNGKDVLSATLNYSAADGTISGECLVEIQQGEDKVTLKGLLSAKLREDGTPSSADIDLSVSLNGEELCSGKLDYELSESESGEKTIILDMTMAVDNTTIDIKSETQINSNKLVGTNIKLELTGNLGDMGIIQPTESAEDLTPVAPKLETFAMTVSVSTLSSSETSVKYHCVFSAVEGEGEPQTISFDVTLGGAQLSLTNDEKLLVAYYESLLENYNDYVARSEDYANAIRQMAEQGILPAVLPESFCLLDPENHKVGYFCDIYRNYDGACEVYCSIDVNDPLNSYLEYYPVVETFFPSK